MPTPRSTTILDAWLDALRPDYIEWVEYLVPDVSILVARYTVASLYEVGHANHELQHLSLVTSSLCFISLLIVQVPIYVTHCYRFDGKAICHNLPKMMADTLQIPQAAAPQRPFICQVSASAAARRFASRSGSTCFFFARSGAAARIERCNPWPHDLWGLSQRLRWHW